MADQELKKAVARSAVAQTADEACTQRLCFMERRYGNIMSVKIYPQRAKMPRRKPLFDPAYSAKQNGVAPCAAQRPGGSGEARHTTSPGRACGMPERYGTVNAAAPGR